MPDILKKKREEGFSVREYLPGDWPEVKRLWQATGLGTTERKDDEETIARTLRQGGVLLLLEKENNVVGCVWLTCDGRRLHMHHMAIDPPFQGKGLSHLLVEESLRIAGKKKIQLKLEVHRENQRAIALYKKWGFRYLGDYDVYIVRNPSGGGSREK